jgi:NAD(P)-dependent dehydrogenase (short-subunit alcohol dehydrogenase family)
MAGQFTGKVALVTGGSSGMGQAAALAFAREGANVVVADTSIQGGEATVRRIKDTGMGALFVPTDASQATAVEALTNTTIATYGRLDGHRSIEALRLVFPDVWVSDEARNYCACIELIAKTIPLRLRSAPVAGSPGE